MKQATVTMSLPGQVNAIALTVQGKPRALPGKLANAIRQFAARRGVAPSAVDYAVTLH